MSNHILLTFEIFGEPTPRRAKVRPTISVSDLILEIAQKCEISQPENYELYRADSPTPLDRALSLGNQQIGENETLSFIPPALSQRRPIFNAPKAWLQLHTNKELFDIKWQPAVIGRLDPQDPTHNALLAVNLDWVLNKMRISRRHAQITVKDGQYYLETLAEQNPTSLNGVFLEAGKKCPLTHQDKIVLQHSQVILIFLLEQKQ